MPAAGGGVSGPRRAEDRDARLTRLARRRDESDRRRVVVEINESAVAEIAPLFTELGTSLDELFAQYPTTELQLLLGAVREVNDRVAQATAALRDRH